MYRCLDHGYGDCFSGGFVRIRKQTSPEMNTILRYHAEWLALYYPEDVVNECRRQALEYRQSKDERQTGAKYEME